MANKFAKILRKLDPETRRRMVTEMAQAIHVVLKDDTMTCVISSPALVDETIKPETTFLGRRSHLN